MVEDGIYDVVITATVTAKIGEKVMFLVEIKQGGIFQMRNIPGDDMEGLLAVMCPNILFPYLREAVSSLTVRAGFRQCCLTRSISRRSTSNKNNNRRRLRRPPPTNRHSLLLMFKVAMPVSLTPTLWMEQLAIRLGCKEPQPSRWLSASGEGRWLASQVSC